MLARTGFALALVVVVVTSALAQKLSPADIRAMVDQRVSGLNEYQVLLNDPDPARSIAAMQIMMESGDPQLERMALDYGLYSASPAVRRAALAAFFNSSPTLELWIDGSVLEDDTSRQGFASGVLMRNGAMSDGSRAFFSLEVGPYNPTNSCWTNRGVKDECLLRLSESSVSINFQRRWQNLTLNDEGELVGHFTTYNVPTPMPASISVTR